MANKQSIMIVGVGGQGTLLASRILGNLLVDKGFDVKVSEVHGMAQRGGSVVTYVKYGEKVYSPVVDKNDADIIIAFEELEALRWLPYLKNDGKIIINTQRIDPMPVIIGSQNYPEGIVDKIKAVCPDVTAIDALGLAKQAGNVKTVNVVLLGVLAKHTDFSQDLWIKALTDTVPSKFLELNKKAFILGYTSKEDE